MEPQPESSFGPARRQQPQQPQQRDAWSSLAGPSRLTVNSPSGQLTAEGFVVCCSIWYSAAPAPPSSSGVALRPIVRACTRARPPGAGWVCAAVRPAAPARAAGARPHARTRKCAADAGGCRFWRPWPGSCACCIITLLTAYFIWAVLTIFTTFPSTATACGAAFNIWAFCLAVVVVIPFLGCLTSIVANLSSLPGLMAVPPVINLAMALWGMYLWSQMGDRSLVGRVSVCLPMYVCARACARASMQTHVCTRTRWATGGSVLMGLNPQP